MHASFDLNHAKLAADPRFAEIARQLSALSPINSRESFNRYCREACRLWNEKFPDGIGETEQFAKLLDQIEHANSAVIRTGWGGVVITLHEHPRVEKYLVVRKGGYLASRCMNRKTSGSRSAKAQVLFFGARLTNDRLQSKSSGPALSFISNLVSSIALSAPKTCSCLSVRSIRKGWIRISSSSTNRTRSLRLCPDRFCMTLNSQQPPVRLGPTLNFL